jgi:aminoglycoside phosphotransferase (APT) family kinase protein
VHARDTAPIRPEERFDEGGVARYLRDQLPDLVGRSGSITFDQFPGGAANLTYRVVAGDSEYVLRRAPLGEVAAGAHDMAREFRVLSRLWRQFPQAPRAYHLCEDDAVMGKPFFVMERRRGWVIRDQWPEDWPEGDVEIRTRLATDLATTLGRLHRVDPDAVGLGDLGRPDGFVARQVAGWRARWEAAQTRHVADLDVAADLLESRLPPPQTATLLHNDYKLDNTMAGDAGDVVAVFDWDMATRGDPLIDLGTLLAYWPDPQSPTFPVFGRQAVALAPYLSKAEVCSIYADVTGFDLAGIEYYEGLALYRIAIIIEQIYARFAAGQTTDERFARFEPLAPLLGAAARRTLELL